MRKAKLVGAAVVIVAVTALTAACGDDDEATTTSAAADIDRFCEISLQLDQAGQEKFEALEQDPDATEKDFEQAEAELVEENADLIEEAQEVAPPEIQSDVETLIAGTRARAGLEDEGPSDEEERNAEARVQDYEQENCG